MIAFRCSICTKVNISTNKDICQHCSNEQTRVSLPENKTEVGSTSTHSRNVFLHMQNNSDGNHFSDASRTSESLYATELYESCTKNKDTKTLHKNRSHISSSLEGPVRSIAENSILKEMLTSPDPTVCSKTFYTADDVRYYPPTKSGASVPTKKLQHISGQPSHPKSIKNLQNKASEHKNNNKAIQSENKKNTVRKMQLGSLWPLSEKSKLDSCTKVNISQIQLKDNQEIINSGKPSRKRKNPTKDNRFQDNVKTRGSFSEHSTCSSQDASRKGCITENFCEKLPIKSIKTPVLKKLFHCNKCSKMFTDESKLQAHFLNHFKRKLFKCDKCEKEYFCEAHLKRHYKSHMDKGPYKCDLCDLVFVRNCHLSRHRKKHILEPSVDASTNQQKVDQRIRQRELEAIDDDDPPKYVQTSTGGKIFLCTECGIRFIRESDFNAHSLRHNVLKPFKCDKCNKEFSYEIYLKRHYRVHSLERPFTCEICGFSSNQKGNLNKHLKIHA